MAENFLDGTGDKPISWWMFEESASPFVDGNTTNANDLTWTPGTDVSRDSLHIQGSFSVKCANDVAGLPQRAFASMSSNYPMKNGASTTAFTAGGWVYLNNTLASAIIHNFLDGTGGYRFRTDDTAPPNTKLVFDAGAIALSSDAATSIGWHWIAGRWNGDNRSGAGGNDEVSFWIDGVKQAATSTQASLSFNGTQPLLFQGYNAGTPQQNHYFDEWFAFNVALLDTQIADIYNHGLDGTRNPVATTGNLAWITA